MRLKKGKLFAYAYFTHDCSQRRKGEHKKKKNQTNLVPALQRAQRTLTSPALSWEARTYCFSCKIFSDEFLRTECFPTTLVEEKCFTINKKTQDIYWAEGPAGPEVAGRAPKTISLICTGTNDTRWSVSSRATPNAGGRKTFEKVIKKEQNLNHKWGRIGMRPPKRKGRK